MYRSRLAASLVVCTTLFGCGDLDRKIAEKNLRIAEEASPYDVSLEQAIRPLREAFVEGCLEGREHLEALDRTRKLLVRRQGQNDIEKWACAEINGQMQVSFGDHLRPYGQILHSARTLGNNY